MNSNILQNDMMEIFSGFENWNDLSGKVVLVTGANGFLPTYIIEFLCFLNQNYLNEKAVIISLVRNAAIFSEKFSLYVNKSWFHVYEKNIVDFSSIDFEIDYVIHAASLASPKFYSKFPVDVLSPNVIGTYKLLDYFKFKNLKAFLYFSSAEIYGSDYIKEISELDSGKIDPLSERACYSESKRMGENIAISFFRQYNVPIKIIRPFHTYGPGLKLDDGRVFADFVSHVINKENIILKSNGLSQRAFCYLSDATLAFLMVLIKGQNGEAYNVGNPNCLISMKELASTLVNLYPNLKLQVNIDGIHNNNFDIVKPNIDKLKKLGWSPMVSIEDGFKRTIESFT